MFRTVEFQFKSGRRIVIRSLSDMSMALDELGWTDDDDPDLMRAAKLVSEAMNGRCSPSAAYRAFVAAAQKQEMLIASRSAAAPFPAID